MDLALPAEMVEGIEAFKEFYEGETKHRKLTWVYTQVGQSFGGAGLGGENGCTVCACAHVSACVLGWGGRGPGM
jgi:hypothetical protein